MDEECNSVMESDDNQDNENISVDILSHNQSLYLNVPRSCQTSDDKDRMSPINFLPEGRNRNYDYGFSSSEDEENNCKSKRPKVKKTSSSCKRNVEQNSVDTFLRFAEKGNLESLKGLLKKEPNFLFSKDSDGYTALHRSCYNGHIDVMKFLLNDGADVAAMTTDGWQPLHSACRWGQTEAASLLLQNGADINAQSKGGQTPLHLAATAMNGTSTLELLLLNRRLDPSLKNLQGETAFEVARRSGEQYQLFDLIDKSISV